MARSALCAFFVFALAACANPAAPGAAAPAGAVHISGALAYRAQSVLPEQTEAVVELRAEESGPPLVESRIALRGRQAPLPFVLSVDRRLLEPGAAYVLLTRIQLAGDILWRGEPRSITLDAHELALGEIQLDPVQHETFAGIFDCAGTLVRARGVYDRLELHLGDEQLLLVRVAAASGARWMLPGDPGTSFWNKGQQALVELRGERLPECQAVPPGTSPPLLPLTAGGQEPGWALRLASGESELLTGYGDQRLRFPTPAPERLPDGRQRYDARPQGPLVDLHEQPCADTMSGMYYPFAVTVKLGDEVLAGCGGEPAELLTGTTWEVVALAGSSLPPADRPDLKFSPEGRLGGSGSCNTYSAAWTLTGESLGIGNIGATKRACAPERMAQEQQFFSLLAQVSGFAIAADGGLRLLVGDREQLRARRKSD